jgi:hypothetical protein
MKHCKDLSLLENKAKHNNSLSTNEIRALKQYLAQSKPHSLTKKAPAQTHQNQHNPNLVISESRGEPNVSLNYPNSQKIQAVHSSRVHKTPSRPSSIKNSQREDPSKPKNFLGDFDKIREKYNSKAPPSKSPIITGPTKAGRGSRKNSISKVKEEIFILPDRRTLAGNSKDKDPRSGDKSFMGGDLNFLLEKKKLQGMMKNISGKSPSIIIAGNPSQNFSHRSRVQEEIVKKLILNNFNSKRAKPIVGMWS